MTQSKRSVAAFWFTVALLLLSVGSSALPSPLYPVYADAWHLTPVMLTGAFAIYVIGLLLALLSAGSLSD
ncbi:MFS transporter, partial [Aeromicrobium sp. IC_218]